MRHAPKYVLRQQRFIGKNESKYFPPARQVTFVFPSVCSVLKGHLLTYLLTYLLTPCSKVLLEKLTGSQLVKNFYGTRKFIAAFTSALHLSLS